MSIKEGLYYSKDHQWISKKADHLVVGITDFAQAELGDIVFAELPEVGEKLNKKSSFAVLESIKAVSDVFMPVSAKIIEINDLLFDNPELINSEPYVKGWLIKIEPENDFKAEDFLTAAEYAEFIS